MRGELYLSLAKGAAPPSLPLRQIPTKPGLSPHLEENSNHIGEPCVEVLDEPCTADRIDKG